MSTLLPPGSGEPPQHPNDVIALEVVDDLTSRSRCDEGFLHVRRRRLRNRFQDGSRSREYGCDVVERPGMDAVCVIPYQRRQGEIYVLLRRCLRPAVHFRQPREVPLPGDGPRLFIWEAVAGVLEKTDIGAAGLVHRAAEELHEEAGIRVDEARIVPLGAGFFPSPGIVSEKLYAFAVECDIETRSAMEGDGSPLEDAAVVRTLRLNDAIAECERGIVEDAKTEIALRRLAARLS